LEIPNHIANEYIIPKDYVKPDIAAGNYYLEWDSSSYGIAQREIAGLRNLINELLPHISSAIYDAAKEIPTIIQKKTATGKAMLIDEMFSPELLLTRRKGRNLAYTIRMKSDGTTILTRTEKILLDNERQICVSWLLGEILFRRH
jgi:hypothetical protein